MTVNTGIPLGFPPRILLFCGLRRKQAITGNSSTTIYGYVATITIKCNYSLRHENGRASCIVCLFSFAGFFVVIRITLEIWVITPAFIVVVKSSISPKVYERARSRQHCLESCIMKLATVNMHLIHGCSGWKLGLIFS